jgi:hypothetical protein
MDLRVIVRMRGAWCDLRIGLRFIDVTPLCS